MHKFINKREILLCFTLATIPMLLGLATWGVTSLLSIVFVSFCMTFVITITIIVVNRIRCQSISKNMNIIYHQVESFVSLQSILAPIIPLPAMRGSAISPDIGCIIIAEILNKKPKVIVECGSGVSTILSSYCLQKNGMGHIWSLDHEKKYASISQKNIESHKLGEYATVLHAPLKEYFVNGNAMQFYDLDVLCSVEKIDLLIIDGPPRTIDLMVRLPALSLFMDKLSDNSVVILDDAARPAEREIVKSWLSEYRCFDMTWYETEKGTVVLKKLSVKAD